jgi:predicted dehydrogenase
MHNFLSQADCQVVAVCDLKNDQLEQACSAVNGQYGNKDCRTYHDFRELVQRKDIDACLIATPDHWHVLTALAAVNSGKDIYVEKPLALTLEEGQALRSALRKKQRVFQFGTQQRSGRLFRFASELVRNGAIGDLKHINVWAPGSAPGGSRMEMPPPPGLDYDFWLGPTLFVPHTQDRCTADNARKTWWFISNYTLGFISGWGIHPMDIALWGGGPGLGQTVSAEGRANFRFADGVCDTATIWEIDYAFGNGVALKFVGVPNGGNSEKATGDPFLHAEEWGQRYGRISTHGTAFEGSSGWVRIDRNGIQLQPESLTDLREENFNTKLTNSPDHARNFLDCVKSRAETVCPIEAAIAVDTMCHIGEAAIRLDRKVTFDFNKEHFVNDSEADHRLKCRPMRKPWTI